MAVNRRTLRSLSLLVGLCILAVIGWQYRVTDAVANVWWREQHWPVVVLGLLGLYIVRPFLLWPLSAISILVGYTFGFPHGLPLVLGGTLVTCSPPFLIAKRFDGEFGYVEWAADRGSALVDSIGELRGTIVARLSPAPADAVSYGAGIAGVSTRTFAAGTLVGELPWAIFYVLLGQSLRTFSATTLDRPDLRLLLVAAVGSLLLLARPIYEHFRGRTERDGSST